MIVPIVLTVHREECMIPGRRLYNATELKGSYVYLASDASNYMTGKTSIQC